MSIQDTLQPIIFTTWNSSVNKDCNVTNDEVISPSDLIYWKFLSSLAKCFLVIFIGYLAAKLRLLNEREANGLEVFVRQFSLPSLIFLTLASVELNSIDWGIIKCFALAKIIIFIIVMSITVSVSKPINVGKAALYSIFCTQSNDLCLGLPIIESLYHNYHPEFSHYLYLLALVQYLMLNPFGFFFMEFQRRTDQHVTVDKSIINVLGAFVKCTFLNPIIVMTFLGILANISWNHQLPVILGDFLNVLGSAFPATALFSLGYSLVANSRSLLGAKLVVPALLIITKILVMPLVNRVIMHLYLDATGTAEKVVYENFAFLYGTIPTAPTVYIFATQFGMETDVVASGMVVSTFLSAPLMFLSGTVNTVADFASSHLQTDLDKAVMYSSILGVLCSLWVLGVLIKMRQVCYVTHQMTFFIVLCQSVAAFGGIFRSVMGPVPLSFGILSSHIWTAILAISISVLYKKSLCFGLYIEKYFVACGCTLCFVIIIPFLVIMRRENMGAMFLYDGTDAYLHIPVLIICICSVICSLIIVHWYSSNQKFILSSSSNKNLPVNASVTECLTDSDTLVNDLASDDQDGVSDIEEVQYPSCFRVSNTMHQPSAQPFPTFCSDNSRCSGKTNGMCSRIMGKYHLRTQKSKGVIFEFYEDRCQITKHVTLVILLFIPMIISLIINLWKFILKKKSGVYIELEFLNAFLCHGLGVISFAVFGIDRNLVIDPCKWWLWKTCYGAQTLMLPEAHKLPLKVQNVCNAFLAYHMKNCVLEIVKDKKVGTRIYHKVFCGNELVDWLLKVGLSQSRLEAEEYGNHLLLGRVIKHIRLKYYFQDLPHLYTFNVSAPDS